MRVVALAAIQRVRLACYNPYANTLRRETRTSTVSRGNVIQDRTTMSPRLRERVTAMDEYLRVDEKRAAISALEEQAAEPTFWDDAQAAQAVMAAALRGCART